MTTTEELRNAILAENTVFTPKIINLEVLKCSGENADWLKATIKTHKFGYFRIPKGWEIYNINVPKKQILELEIVRYK